MFLSATVRASSCKSCFVSLSNDLVQRLATSIKGPAKVFQIEWDGGQAYCSWSGETAVTRSSGFLQSSVVEMGRKFADLNGIRIREQVVLTPLDKIPSCTRIHVDPLSADDWEIVELHAGFIESNLLNQVRVVWQNQVVPVWINDTVFVSIRIGEIEPEASCVLLQEFTEVVISPKQRQQPSSTTRQQPNHGLQEMQSDNIASTTVNENVSSFYRIWRYLFAGEEQSNSERTTQTLSKKSIDVHDSESVGSQFNCCKSLFAEIQINICLRTHSDLITWNENHHEDLYSQQLSCIFVNPDSVGWNLLQCNRPHKCLNDFNGWCKMVTIRKLLSPKEKSELLNIEKRKSSKESDKMSNNSTYKLDPHLKPVIVRMVLSSQVLPGNVVLQKQLQKQLGAGAISCFQVAETKQTPQEIKGIILHLEASQKDDVGSSQDIINSFHNWIAMTTSEECPLIIWNGMTMSINTNRDTCLELIVGVLSHVEDNKDFDSIPYYYITASILQHITVVVGDQKSIPKTPALLCQMQADNTVQLSCSIHDLGGFTEVFNKCLNHMLICLDKSPSHLSLTKGLSNGAVLIHGSGLHAGQGCGKTSLGHALCKELQQCPTGAHVIYIDCITLRAKRVETIQRQWQQAFLEAAWYQPSVILLDNLDHVITAPSLTQEMGGEGLYRLRLVQVFKDLISAEIVNKSKIVVIATSRSQDSLHSTIQSGHGVHVFQCCVELGPLNQCQRYQVLSKLIVKKSPAIHYDELETIVSSTARKCEGFSPKDLCALIDRALHFALVRRIDGNQDSIGSLLLDDFSQALTGFSPASLRGVQLHKPSKHTWLDVGGLHDVKKALQETLLWPTKYTGLFSRCPLRLRSGLLLYGPPGSGKTLLAGVIANESGLNFISIKGPELLSKYIGASEQAVRDVFSRAQTARPCILFFDEFDALAPRRGHDSTGVTDRVVNQLLTQLDGVEGLEGVFILAATSRPGLIDPALLRPGRLDKCVYCPMPNQSDRLEILQALTRNISLGDNVNLQSIAERCEEFTGADLKALLYNAQLECIHRKTSKLKLYGGVLDDGSDMRKAENIQMQSEDCVITICQSDLDKAVLTMRPSVSPNERLMYESTFDSFTRSRGNSFTKNTFLKGRATLA